MTREEKQKAIDVLKISAPVITVTQKEFEDYIQTLNKIMDWLEQEPCGDAISRAEVLSHAKTEWGNGHEQPFDYVEADVIRQLPPVTPAEKVGQWIYEKRERLINETDEGAEYVTDYWCKCSKCGGDFGYRKMKDAFCKYCGAKMQEV